MAQAMGFLRDDHGEVSIEYAILAGALLVLIFGAFTFLGQQISDFVHKLPGLLGF